MGACCRDPHPGNLLVTPKGELCYLDYGMMGVLPADTRTELVALLVNFVNKDEVIMSPQHSGRENIRKLLQKYKLEVLLSSTIFLLLYLVSRAIISL